MQKPIPCPEPNPPSNNGLNMAEATELCRGWAAARKGDPYDVSEGSMWVEGFLTYEVLHGIPGRHRQR